ncbi:MAG TPA: hypothetical protein VNO17_08655 [Actinomycetota bacterium]|nr:hypothetical protein [Actinomycetota bacterium]
MDRYERIRQLRDEYESALDEAERLRQRYHSEIRKLHRAGASLRDIGEALGMSHQRVHQIVSSRADAVRARRRRAAVAAATSALLILGVGAAFLAGDLKHPGPTTPEGAPGGGGPGGRAAITFGCDVSPGGGTTIVLAERCQELIEDLLRGRAGIRLIALDPGTGELLAMVSDGARPSRLQDRLAATSA